MLSTKVKLPLRSRLKLWSKPTVALMVTAFSGYLSLTWAILPALLFLTGCSDDSAARQQSNSPAAAQQAGVTPDLPNEFKVVERVIALTNTLDLVNSNNNNKLGTITEKFFSLTREFKYTDNSGNVVATARARILSWGTEIEVSDGSGRLIGTIKEQVFNSLFKVSTTYSILDASGKEIATSEKVELLATHFTLNDKSGRLIAKIDRPWLKLFRDVWSVKISNPGAVDARLLVMIAAYKTAKDNERSSSSD